jgi:hypothetical protein
MGNAVTSTTLDNYPRPTDDELKNGDPMVELPRELTGYSLDMGDLLLSLTGNVTTISKEITTVTGMMNSVNSGLGKLKGQTDGDTYPVATFTDKASALAFMQQWVDEKAMPQFSSTPTGTQFGDTWGNATTGLSVRDQNNTHTTYTVYFQPAGGQALQTNLQNKVNDLTSQNQQQQLVLQTVTGRLNSLIDMISSLIKRNDTQLQSLLNNFRR